MRCGEAALIVDGLAKKALPKTRPEAEPTVAALEELMSKYATTTCVLFKKSGLQRLARASLEVLSTDVDPALAVHGKITPAQDGAVTLTYEFDSPDESLDFVMNKGHLAAWRKAYSKIRFAEDDSKLEVKDGNLSMLGDAMWRLPVGFSVPLTLKATFRFEQESGTLNASPHLAFSVCDDGKQSYVNVSSLGDMHVWDAESGKNSSVRSKITSFHWGRAYKLELGCENGKVTAIVDGETASTSDLGPRASGGVELMLHCETPILLERLEITGKLEPASLAALRKAWAERKLVAMGF